jgi:CheY-like chemotaxis protein
MAAVDRCRYYNIDSGLRSMAEEKGRKVFEKLNEYRENTMARIVVLEDDASTRRLITAVLTKAGHAVTDVDNGAEGLLIVLAEQPDLVVSDVEMPKMNGFEVLQQIRLDTETAKTPVILLTSLTSEADIQRGLSDGANDYITKPFEPATLLQSVAARLTQAALGVSTERSSLSGFAQSSAAALELTGLPTLNVSAPEGGLALEPMDLHTPTAGLAPEVVTTPAPVASRPMGNAWALNLQVLNHQVVKPLLAARDWRSLLRQLFLPVSKDAALKVADYLDLIDASLTLYFLDEATGGRRGAERAALAVEAMVRAGATCRQWAAAQFPALAATPVRVVVSLHRGPIEIIRMPLDFGGERDTVVGETAECIARMRSGKLPLLWRVAATDVAVQAAKGLYRQGAQMDVEAGDQELRVHALLGLNGDPGVGQRVDAAHWI